MSLSVDIRALFFFEPRPISQFAVLPCTIGGMNYFRIPFKRRWIFSTGFVILLALAMVGLGFWQLDRHHQRMAYIDAVEKEVEDAPFVLQGAPEEDAYAERIFHQVQARGEFDFAHQVAIKNKFYDEAMGYDLVTPFKIDGSDRAVLVSRGWIPPDAIHSPADARQFDEPHLTSIGGRILATEESAEPPTSPQFFWYRVDVAAIQQQLPYEILPFYVALTPPEQPQTAAPFRDPPKFKLDPGAHFGNAIQWFLFALLVPAFYIWLVVREDAREQAERDV